MPATNQDGITLAEWTAAANYGVDKSRWISEFMAEAPWRACYDSTEFAAAGFGPVEADWRLSLQRPAPERREQAPPASTPKSTAEAAPVTDGAVLGVLAKATVEGNCLRLAPDQLDRALYVRVAKVLTGLGGKWKTNARVHEFAITDLAERVEGMIQTGKFTRIKNDLGFFRTPYPLARSLADEVAAAGPGLYLEPSAGDGGLALPLTMAGVPMGSIRCLEIDAERAERLEEGGFGVECADFLEWRTVEAFDGILMNPPFNKGVDAAHIMKALDHLAPGGILRAIASAGVKFKGGTAQALRDRVAAMGGTITDLLPLSFASEGTSVNTVVVRVGGILR